MNSSLSNGSSKRTMRVATLFTGAAACAITAFAPTALAATAADGNQNAGRPHTGRDIPMLHTGGTITSSVCGTDRANYSTWMEMIYKGAYICYGFTGTTAADQHGNWGSSTTSICGGNNVGWYSSNNSGRGPTKKATFREGTTFVGLPNVPWQINKVHISGWSGGNKCP
jgi:hypothetical protein